MTRDMIYVVDDEPVMRQALEMLLRHGGFEVRTFATAEEVLAAVESMEARRERVTVILLDMYLGPRGMSGDECFRILASRRRQFEVIVMSGRLSAHECFRYILAGAANYLIKPFDASGLNELVRRHSAVGAGRWDYAAAPWTQIRRAQRDVFLCHCREDRAAALGMKRLLEREGFSAWYSEPGAGGTSPWRQEELEDALKKCRTFLLWLSPHAAICPEVQQQVETACRRRNREGGNFFAAVLRASDSGGGGPAAAAGWPVYDLTGEESLVDTFMTLAAALRSALHRPMSGLET
jgi:FixJ family two-component response regulator